MLFWTLKSQVLVCEGTEPMLLGDFHEVNTLFNFEELAIFSRLELTIQLSAKIVIFRKFVNSLQVVSRADTLYKKGALL